MKVQVIYSSISGCTKRLAEAIYNGVTADEKSIHDLKDGTPVLDGDIIFLGYWGKNGLPNNEMKAFLKTVKGKVVGIFCTLGYYADSEHAYDTVRAGIDMVKKDNEVICSYVCNGAVSRQLIAGQGKDTPHVPNEQKEIRWEVVKSHPTKAECDLAAERFSERIYLYNRCKELNIPFRSIL